MSDFKLELKENRRKMAICERHPRYDVVLNGKVAGELFFNMRGYAGYLPTPDGVVLDIGEKGISAFKRAVSDLNREAKQMAISARQVSGTCAELSAALSEGGTPTDAQIASLADVEYGAIRMAVGSNDDAAQRLFWSVAQHLTKPNDEGKSLQYPPWDASDAYIARRFKGFALGRTPREGTEELLSINAKTLEENAPAGIKI